jgi:hypothetical protein
LNEVSREPLAQAPSLLVCDVRQPLEVAVKQAKQSIERSIVATVWCGCQKNNVTRGRLGQPAEQLISLVASLARRSTRVSLIDDDEFWAGAEELAAATVALDVVQTNNRVGMRRENALTWG